MRPSGKTYFELAGEAGTSLDGLTYLVMGALGLGAMPIALPFVATMVLNTYGPMLARHRGWPMLPTLLGIGALIGVVASVPFALMFHVTSKGGESGIVETLAGFALWGIWASWPAALVLWRYLKVPEH